MSIFSFNKIDASTLKKLNRKVKKSVPKGRYNHCVGVAYTASCLAMKYGADINSALVAGLLHDCAKKYSGMELLALCDKYGVLPSEAERINPDLLHAKIGSVIAKKKYGIKNEEILNAIASHTTGHANMDLLEKIIYIADYIEPSRKIIPNLDNIRKLAFTDIDECIAAVAKQTIEHLENNKSSIDPMTMETLDYYSSITTQS